MVIKAKPFTISTALAGFVLNSVTNVVVAEYCLLDLSLAMDLGTIFKLFLDLKKIYL